MVSDDNIYIPRAVAPSLSTIMVAIRGRRILTLAVLLTILLSAFLLTDSRPGGTGYLKNYLSSQDQSKQPHRKGWPKYLPEPKWTPPPIKDHFPLLSSSKPLPPIPSWNHPKEGLYKDYGLDYAPPLFIGFTRTWPILLQAVVSYVTAGWPADQIYVVENTGVQRANLQGKLTLQNPFYLDYAALKKLGVNVIRTPVLMNFAQLQNFYVHLSYEMEAPYYFWSHMDVLVLSYEDRTNGDEGYRTVYELCLKELRRVLGTDERWADKFFSYDHLTLVNRDAYEDIGGWDTFIPFYMTDCDMHSRLLMENYTQLEASAGIITDVSAALDNLLALYREPSIEPTFRDPNPPPPPPPDPKVRRSLPADEDAAMTMEDGLHARPARAAAAKVDDADLVYWRKLQALADQMFHYKHGDRGRNTWQAGQQGGRGEPFYYPARGLAESIEVLTEAGREVFRRKWGHRDCDLLSGAHLQLEDQWRVAPDWE